MAGERAGDSLHATALFNEAYLRLIHAKDVAWHDGAHFVAVAARVRDILWWTTRVRAIMKGVEATRSMSLWTRRFVAREPDHDFVALDEALTTVAAVGARKSQVVEKRPSADSRSTRRPRRCRSTRYGETRLAIGEAVVAARGGGGAHDVI